MTQELVRAVYRIETPLAPEHAAEVMAGEQSTGTFVDVPGETDEIKHRHRARIEAVRDLETVSHPTLPGARNPRAEEPPTFHRAEVVLAFPAENFGPSLPNLLATVAGNLYELREFSGLRLLDLEFPASFEDSYPGPKFGIEGTRELTGVRDRPVIGTIIKPNVGVRPDDLRPVVRELALAGVDFIKDDELLADPPYCPLKDRVRTVMEEIDRAADQTGKRVMYAFNITSDLDTLRSNHDVVVAGGGNCVMVSINSIGLAGVRWLNQYSQVPIHGHRNQWGMMTRCPQLGMSFVAYQKLWRLAGVDHLHTNGLDNKFFESNDEVVESITACLAPMWGGYRTMPVLSSGQWAGQAPQTWQRLKTVDVMHLSGGGIHGHPGGVRAGVQSLQQGWEAALAGIDLDRYAEDHLELQQALDMFRRK